MTSEATRTGPTDGRRVAAAARRRKREAEILAATRALFDERGVRDAQIDDVARAVGINRAIIYRHASGHGALQLARLGLVVSEAAPGVPIVQQVKPDVIREQVVAAALTFIKS